jgi:hypothetical protein
MVFIPFDCSIIFFDKNKSINESEGDYKEIKEALDGANNLESFISSVDSITVEIYSEKVYRLRFFACISRTVILPITKRAFSNERMNIYITRDVSMLNFSIIIKKCWDCRV